jgi:hypothetical protein
MSGDPQSPQEGATPSRATYEMLGNWLTSYVWNVVFGSSNLLISIVNVL